MTRDLVRENFRYVNGMVARNQPVTVVLRGTDTKVSLYGFDSGSLPAPNPFTTDSYGNVSFYAEAGFYDFLALGGRIPFDVEPDIEVTITPEDLESVVDQVNLELEPPIDLVLLYENAKV